MELAWLSRDAPPISLPPFANAKVAVVTPEAVGEGGIGWGGEVTVTVQDSVVSSPSPPFRGSLVDFSPTRPVVRSPPLRLCGPLALLGASWALKANSTTERKGRSGASKRKLNSLKRRRFVSVLYPYSFL